MSNLFFVAKKKKSVGKKKSISKKKPVVRKVIVKRPSRPLYHSPKKTASPLILDAKDPFDDISRNAVEDLKMCREDAARSLKRITDLESELASLRDQSEKCLKDSSSLRSQSEKCVSDLSKCNSDLSKKVDAFRRMTDKSGVGKSRSERRAAAKDIEDLYEGIGVDIEAREKRRADKKAAKGSYKPPTISGSGYKALPGDDLFAGLTVKQPSKDLKQPLLKDQEDILGLGGLFGFKRSSKKSKRSVKKRSMKKKSMKKRSVKKYSSKKSRR